MIPWIRTPCFHCRGKGFNPGGGSRILHAAGAREKNFKEEKALKFLESIAVSTNMQPFREASAISGFSSWHYWLCQLPVQVV